MQDAIIKLVEGIVPDDGQHIWGFADLQGLLHPRFAGFNYGITIGRKLDDAIMDTVMERPNPRYYKLYLDTNAYLLDLVTRLSRAINSLGAGSLVIRPTSSPEIDRSPDYPRTLRHHFSHKMVGTRAGLGWIGKTDLFVSSKFGPRLRLVSLLIDYPLQPLQPPIEKSRCGKCRICVDVCPAGAANGRLWDTGVDRDQFYDAFKCQKKALELSREFASSDHEICGVCMAACPLGRKNKS